MKRLTLFLWALLVLTLAACSLPPETPVTLDELMKTRIYRIYVIEESPEEILHALNADGEVIVEGVRKVGKREFPVYVKILATSEGLDVSDYDR